MVVKSPSGEMHALSQASDSGQVLRHKALNQLVAIVVTKEICIQCDTRFSRNHSYVTQLWNYGMSENSAVELVKHQ